MGKNVANPFKWEHLLYGLAGLVIGALLGYFVGVFLMAITVSSASFMSNTTMAYFFGYRFSDFPLIFTFLGAAIGLFIGLIYSHEKESGQPHVIVLPQAPGTQTPVIVVHQPQQPQAPPIVVVPQGGQQPIVVTPQQAQQQK